MAFQVYEMCAEGCVDPAWKVDKPITAVEFRQCRKQMCQYCAQNLMNPGDQNLRQSTQ